MVKSLPENLPAAIFIVVHVSPESPGLLAGIIQSNTKLPCTYPSDYDPIELGHIYIAPPNYHLLVGRDIIRVVRGPRENRHRPAIDPLFRSAARNYGPRVIGVILTGMLDDGTAGMLVIKQRGGLAVVQDPNEALYPAMPNNVLNRVKEVDYVTSVANLPSLLVKLVEQVPADQDNQKMGQVAEQLEIETAFAMSEIPNYEVLNKISKPSSLTCPDCHGVLWEIEDEHMLRYRCRVGHSFTAQSLVSEQAEALEDALWIALRSLEEEASLNRRLAERAKGDNQMLSASNFMESAMGAEQHANTIKRVLFANRNIDEKSSDIH